MNKSIKDRLMITKIGYTRIISSTLALILLSCNRPQKVPDLDFTYEKYEDGRIKELGMKKDSMKEGLWISFYPNGKINGIEFFDHDKWNGPIYYFHENGQLSIYRETKDGVFHGKGYNYYHHGVVAGNVNFIDDKQDGIFENYDDEGKLMCITEYKDGKYVRTIYGPEPFEVND